MLELLERPPRLEAQLVHERAPRVLVGLERLGLTAGAVEGEHELRAHPLPVRVRRREPLELADQLRVAAERQVGVEAVLDRGQAQLLQPGDVGLERGLESEVAERGPAPEREGARERRRGRLGPAGAKLRPRIAHRVLEAMEVEPRRSPGAARSQASAS